MKEDEKMRRSALNKSIVAALLCIALLLGVFTHTSLAAQRRHYKRHHHSKTKGAIIGGVAGAVGGALIGGKKGAVIGGGAGAGTGYLIQRHRNRRSYRRNR